MVSREKTDQVEDDQIIQGDRNCQTIVLDHLEEQEGSSGQKANLAQRRVHHDLRRCHDHRKDHAHQAQQDHPKALHDPHGPQEPKVHVQEVQNQEKEDPDQEQEQHQMVKQTNQCAPITRKESAQGPHASIGTLVYAGTTKKENATKAKIACTCIHLNHHQ